MTIRSIRVRANGKNLHGMEYRWNENKWMSPLRMSMELGVNSSIDRDYQMTAFFLWGVNI